MLKIKKLNSRSSLCFAKTRLDQSYDYIGIDFTYKYIYLTYTNSTYIHYDTHNRNSSIDLLLLIKSI